MADSGVDSYASSSVPSGSSSEDLEGSSDIRWVEPPLGPLSAFDFHEGRVVFFEEKYNRIVVAEPNGNEAHKRTMFVVPEQFVFGMYYWATVHFVSRNMLVCLLKHHSSRLFSLVTMAMDEKMKKCDIMDEALTDITIEGYQIWSQRGEDQGAFVYSFTNKRPSKKPSTLRKKKKLMKSVSDKTLFCDQMRQALEAESTATETRSLQPIAMHRRTISTESERISKDDSDRPRLEETTRTEAVMLEARVDSTTGKISHRVLSVGKRTVRLRLSTSNKRRTFSDSLRVKQMNRLSPPVSPSSRHSNDSPISFSSSPFLLANHAIIVDPLTPTEALVVPVKNGDTNGMLGAIASRLRKPMSSRRVDLVPVPIQGRCPSRGGNAVWSDFHVEGHTAILAVQTPPSNTLKMWRLVADFSTRPGSSPSAALSLSWQPLSEIPLSSSSSTSTTPQRVHEMRLSLSPDHRACCIRGSCSNSEDDDKPAHFCFTFDRMRLTV